MPPPKRGFVNFHSQETNFPMETLIALGILGWLGAWCYAKGKRIGSIKGYHVGRSRRRR